MIMLMPTPYTMIQADGSIKTYKLSEYNIRPFKLGQVFISHLRTIKEEKFQKAIDFTLEVSSIHIHGMPMEVFGTKKIYPNQMWLDGLSMGDTFLR